MSGNYGQYNANVGSLSSASQNAVTSVESPRRFLAARSASPDRDARVAAQARLRTGALAAVTSGEQANPQQDEPPKNLLLDLPAYPQWEPEVPSTWIELDSMIASREGMTLHEAGQRMRTALREAGYELHSFYSVPGGFLLITDYEQTDPEGVGYSDIKRYQKPGEGRDSWWLILRDLFLERPHTYYRTIAIVVTDEQWSPDEKELSAEDAARRVQLGSQNLGQEAKKYGFTQDHTVTALIYEYVNKGVDTNYEMISPGRLPVSAHLAASGLDRAIPKQFASAMMNAQAGQ